MQWHLQHEGFFTFRIIDSFPLHVVASYISISWRVLAWSGPVLYARLLKSCFLSTWDRCLHSQFKFCNLPSRNSILMFWSTSTPQRPVLRDSFARNHINDIINIRLNLSSSAYHNWDMKRYKRLGVFKAQYRNMLRNTYSIDDYCCLAVWWVSLFC